VKTAETPSFWEKIVRLLYPAKCMLCDEILREDTPLYLCDACRKTLPRCVKGFQKMPQIPHVTGVLAAFYYEQGIDKAIKKMKFSHQPVLSETLAYLLYDEMMKEPSVSEFDFIVPIPMHPGKKRRRGYNQSELVGRYLSRYLDIPLKTDILCKIRNTRPQSRLNREERLRNLDGVFIVKNSPELEGKIILLVDDVVTTGTTLNTCAKILLENGASGVFSTVIAIAEK
jgi:ComF family protein